MTKAKGNSASRLSTGDYAQNPAKGLSDGKPLDSSASSSFLAVFSLMKILSAPRWRWDISSAAICMVDNWNDTSRHDVDLHQHQEEVASVLGRTLPVRQSRHSHGSRFYLVLLGLTGAIQSEINRCADFVPAQLR